MVIRSFLAFELPEEIKGIISRISEEMRRFPLDVKWIRPDNIHLTVLFMGNILTDDLREMGDRINGICMRYAPFCFSLNGAGVFSNRRNPRILWVGVDGDIERMSYFRDALQKHLGPFGVKREKRRFNPHLTLGRFRKGGAPTFHLDELLSRYQHLTTRVCVLKELVLFKSDLRPGGAVYTNVDTWPLMGKH
ncbi:MAG: RNA 2',3'-cyclic phosphodiesterase [Thermodesulfobacteriota bacterium]|nr:RNA 2',3'-cyclic phosphodiesterase [Thermodesulfobacteriota bacterium]